MRICLFLSFLAALAGCKNNNDTPPVISQSHNSLNDSAQHVYGRFAYKMIQEHGLWGYNVVLPVSQDCIETMGMQLLTMRMIPLAQARGILLVAGSALLEEIKNQSQIQPYLPPDFGWDNIMLGITFVDQAGKRVADSESVTSVALVDGHLIYRSFDPKIGKCQVVHKETAKEAYKEMVASKFWDQKWDWSLLATSPPPGSEWLAAEDQRANILELNTLYSQKYSQAAPRPQINDQDKTNLSLDLKKSKDSVTKLNVNLPSNFVFGFEDSSNEFFMFEYIPKGEDLNGWTEIITISQYKMQNPRITDYIRNMAKQYSGTGADFSHEIRKEKDLPVALTITDLDAVTPSMVPSLKGSRISQKKELVMTKIYQGDQSMSVVQYSIRYDTGKTTLTAKDELKNKMERFLNTCTIE